jgi:DNA primase
MSQVQQIKEATNIVEIIAERLELQRAGGHSKARCPFHSEKSPSFFVSESMQRYKCFGCGESGDVITFLQKYEGMTFLEALEYLADRAGIALQKFTRSAMTSQAEAQRKKILEVLDLTQEYYHYLLTQHSIGAKARQYLKNRQIKSESISLFKIGYSPEDWDGLFNYLTKKKKYSTEVLLEAGLIIKSKKGKYYDRFRDRVMFPLRNHRGQTVGFSGRVLNPDIKEAKYINSPETAVYHKSSMLFGLAELMQQIRKARWVVVVEGELDVIASVQAHVNEVVAVKGSALTEDHAKLLVRVVEKVILSMDSDSAGITATKRAIQVLSPHDLEIRVASVPAGKDPDELVKQDPKLWRDTVKRTLSIYEFLINQAVKTHGSDTGESKKKVLQEVGLVLAQMSHVVEQDYYIKLLAEKLNVREDLVREDVRRAERLGVKNYSKSFQDRPRSENLRTDNFEFSESSSGNSTAKNTDSGKSATHNLAPAQARLGRLEKYLAFLFYQFFIPPYFDLQSDFLLTVTTNLSEVLDYEWQHQNLKSLLTSNLEYLNQQELELVSVQSVSQKSSETSKISQSKSSQSKTSQSKSSQSKFSQSKSSRSKSTQPKISLPITIDKLAKNLAPDYAEVIMQIAYQPKAIAMLSETSLEKEWKIIVAQLKKLGLESRINSLTAKLKKFDQKNTLSDLEEKEQSQLLKTITDLKRASI